MRERAILESPLHWIFCGVQTAKRAPANAGAGENNITNGISATEFGVGGTCNRAQVVTFLYRTYNK